MNWSTRGVFKKEIMVSSTRDFAHSQASIAAVMENMKRSEFDRMMVIYFNRIIRQWKGPMSKRMKRYIKRERHLRNEQKRAMKRGFYDVR